MLHCLTVPINKMTFRLISNKASCSQKALPVCMPLLDVLCMVALKLLSSNKANGQARTTVCNAVVFAGNRFSCYSC